MKYCLWVCGFRTTYPQNPRFKKMHELNQCKSVMNKGFAGVFYPQKIGQTEPLTSGSVVLCF